MSTSRTLVQVTAVGAICLAAFAGCKKTPPPAPPPEPVSADVLAAVRQEYAAERPGVRVGRVVEALPDASFVSVTEIPMDDVRDGSVVSFVDAQRHVIAHGRVVRRLPDALHVRYEPAQGAGGRAPAVGDLAVYLGQ